MSRPLPAVINRLRALDTPWQMPKSFAPPLAKHMHLAPSSDSQGEPDGLARLDEQALKPVRGSGADRVVLRRTPAF